MVAPKKFFISFLDKLDNSKHFETYLFFGHFLVKSAAECGPHSAAGCGRVRKVRIRSRDLKSDQKSIFIIFIYKWRHLMAKFALNKTTHADSAI